jgi:hypothetical protein
MWEVQRTVVVELHHPMLGGTAHRDAGHLFRRLHPDPAAAGTIRAVMTRHTLRPWQIEALRRIQGQPRVALFMEMRLGKTPVIIQWAMAQTADSDRPRLLVVAPMATLDDWDEELGRFGIRPTRLDRATTATRMEYVEGAGGWHLVHPEAVRLTPAMADVEWDAIIVDESTMIRNPKAKITKTLVHGYQHVPHRAILTGDPRPESDLDYFCQMQFLHGDFMGFRNYWVFRNVKFQQSPFLKWEWSPRPGTRDEIKAYVHDRAVVMTAEGVGMGNEQIFKTRAVDMNDAQRKVYRELTKKFSFEYIETNFATVRDVWMARIAGGFSPDRENPELLSGAKTEGIIDLMRGELAHQSSVIWFRFNEELHYVTQRLNASKIRSISVHGATPREDRKKVREAFTAGTYQVLCVQVRLGRMGWNLAKADVAQYYSNAYDYESRAQSMKRIEHMTRQRPLLYIDWVTRGTLDEEVVRLLKEKRMDSRQFMRALDRTALASLRRLHESTNPSAHITRHDTPQTQKRITRRYPGTRETG